jgi:osmotically inducible protein OsmC
MIKHASAVWSGSIRDGGGTISTETGILDQAPYGFKSRFKDGPGTNPEELIGAAHAACPVSKLLKANITLAAALTA